MKLSPMQARWMLRAGKTLVKEGFRRGKQFAKTDGGTGVLGGAAIMAAAAPVYAAIKDHEQGRAHEQARRYARRHGGSDIGPYETPPLRVRAKQIGKSAVSGAVVGAVLGGAVGKQGTKKVAKGMIAQAGRSAFLRHIMFH